MTSCNLISSLKTLSPNTVTFWDPGVRTSPLGFGGDTTLSIRKPGQAAGLEGGGEAAARVPHLKDAGDMWAKA